jgi:hypothetical protein
MYQSDFTKFMNDYLQNNPQVESQRQELRLTWWDRKLDLDDLRRWSESRVAQKSYVYQPD